MLGAAGDSLAPDSDELRSFLIAHGLKERDADHVVMYRHQEQEAKADVEREAVAAAGDEGVRKQFTKRLHEWLPRSGQHAESYEAWLVRPHETEVGHCEWLLKKNTKSEGTAQKLSSSFKRVLAFLAAPAVDWSAGAHASNDHKVLTCL